MTTTTKTTEKVRAKYKYKPNHGKKKKFKSKCEDKPNEEIVTDEVKKKETRPKLTNGKDKVRKMFISTIDPHDAPLTWWETEHNKLSISEITTGKNNGHSHSTTN